MNWKHAIIPLLSYFIGAVPFSYLVARMRTGGDIRIMGSGNVGATNVLRTSGKWAGFLALLLDVTKGAGSVWLGQFLTGSASWGAAAGSCAMVGHSYPVFLKFRGGKSVATGAGAFLVLSPLGIITSILVFAIMIGLFRIVSLGSIAASASFPFFAWIYGSSHPVVLLGALSAGFIIFRHRENVRRLLRGTERKMGERKDE